MAELNDNGVTQTESEQLEQIIDRRGLQAVVQELSTICGAKADHIEHNWQDKPLARRWATAEGAIGVASTKIGAL